MSNIHVSHFSWTFHYPTPHRWCGTHHPSCIISIRCLHIILALPFLTFGKQFILSFLFIRGDKNKSMTEAKRFLSCFAIFIFSNIFRLLRKRLKKLTKQIIKFSLFTFSPFHIRYTEWHVHTPWAPHGHGYIKNFYLHLLFSSAFIYRKLTQLDETSQYDEPKIDLIKFMYSPDGRLLFFRVAFIRTFSKCYYFALLRWK